MMAPKSNDLYPNCLGRKNIVGLSKPQNRTNKTAPWSDFKAELRLHYDWLLRRKGGSTCLNFSKFVFVSFLVATFRRKRRL